MFVIKEQCSPRHAVHLEQDGKHVSVLVDGYYILKITEDGIIRTGSVPSQVGIKLEHNRVVILN